MARDQSVDAAGEGLGAVEALVAEPHGDGEGALAVMAEDDDVGVGVEFGVGAGGDFAHGHQQGVGQAGGLELPWLADVQEDGGVWRVGRWSGVQPAKACGVISGSSRGGSGCEDMSSGYLFTECGFAGSRVPGDGVTTNVHPIR